MFKKTDSKEMEIHETSDFKLKDWCQLKGIRAEIKNVSWLSKKELAKNSAVVLLFNGVILLWWRCRYCIYFKSIGDELRWQE